MNSIQKGSMTVVVSTVIASAAILMTGNSVANDNENQKEGAGSPVTNAMPLDASGKELSGASSSTTPPPPAGPFLGDGAQLVSDTNKVSDNSSHTSPKLSPPMMSSGSQKVSAEPKAPGKPTAPSQPMSVSSAKAPQAALSPKAPVASEKGQAKAVQPANGVANTAEKAKALVVPKTPDSPVAKTVDIPQKVVKEMIEPSKPEKAINSFKPTAPEMEMTGKQTTEQLEAPKLGKAVSSPKVSLQSPNSQIPAVSKPQPQIKKPMAPMGTQVDKAPVMPNQVVNVQRPIQPQNMNQGRPVMPRNMGNGMMPRQQYYQQKSQQNNQQANNRPPLWKEKMWQQNNYPSRSNGSVNAKQRAVPQQGQQRGQNKMMPPKGMYQYAPVYPSNYGYPQMPMWNNNGYYYQMMPYYWPVMPQKMPQGMPQNSQQQPSMPNANNVQGQGAFPPSNVQDSIEGSSMNGKK